MTPSPHWSKLSWIESHSRWVLRAFFRRNLDTFSEDARRVANWAVLIGDVLLIWTLLKFVF